MKYSVDKIEEDIAILENIETKELLEVNVKLLPNDLLEGNILVYLNNNFLHDKDLEEERRKIMREKFERLRKV